jgi:hypothetical protein
MIGDRKSDAEFGSRAGLYPILLGEDCEHFAAAADFVIGREVGSARPIRA